MVVHVRHRQLDVGPELRDVSACCIHGAARKVATENDAANLNASMAGILQNAANIPISHAQDIRDSVGQLFLHWLLQRMSEQ